MNEFILPSVMTSQQLITVLIVDDDEDDLFFIEQAFRQDSLHTQVYAAAGGEQAFELLGSGHLLPNVILLDLNMPGMTGFEVLAHLKQSILYQFIPVIILSTSESFTDQEKARQLGAIEFVTKPITSGALSVLAERIRFSLLN